MGFREFLRFGFGYQPFSSLNVVASCNSCLVRVTPRFEAVIPSDTVPTVLGLQRARDNMQLLAQSHVEAQMMCALSGI